MQEVSGHTAIKLHRIEKFVSSSFGLLAEKTATESTWTPIIPVPSVVETEAVKGGRLAAHMRQLQLRRNPITFKALCLSQSPNDIGVWDATFVQDVKLSPGQRFLSNPDLCKPDAYAMIPSGTWTHESMLDAWSSCALLGTYKQSYILYNMCDKPLSAQLALAETGAMYGPAVVLQPNMVRVVSKPAGNSHLALLSVFHNNAKHFLRVEKRCFSAKRQQNQVSIHKADKCETSFDIKFICHDTKFKDDTSYFAPLKRHNVRENQQGKRISLEPCSSTRAEPVVFDSIWAVKGKYWTK